MILVPWFGSKFSTVLLMSKTLLLNLKILKQILVHIFMRSVWEMEHCPPPPLVIHNFLLYVIHYYVLVTEVAYHSGGGGGVVLEKVKYSIIFL